MKKIISLILLCAIGLGLCACGNANIQPRFVGYWENADGSAKLTLNADGTAVFTLNTAKTDADGIVMKDENGKVIPSEANGTYDLVWTAETNSNITLKWKGEPVPAIVTEEKTEETTPATEATTPVEEGAEGEAAEGEAAATTTSSKRVDRYTVGFGSMTVKDGKMILTLLEGTSDDILLFQFGAEKALEKKK